MGEDRERLADPAYSTRRASNRIGTPARQAYLGDMRVPILLYGYERFLASVTS
jgi:hypothetical protein